MDSQKAITIWKIYFKDVFPIDFVGINPSIQPFGPTRILKRYYFIYFVLLQIFSNS